MIGRLRMVGVAVVCLTLIAGASVALAESPLTVEAQGRVGNGPYTPPACVPGVPFADITCTTGFDPWIEQFGLDGITAGCGGGLYCPGSPVTRDQMAVFIEKSMRGTANWPPHLSQVYAVLNADGSVDTVASGDQLRSAIAAIPSTGPAAPTSTNHWLVKVGPGHFTLGDGGLSLLPYVDLAGSGMGTTTIASTSVVGNFASDRMRGPIEDQRSLRRQRRRFVVLAHDLHHGWRVDTRPGLCDGLRRHVGEQGRHGQRWRIGDEGVGSVRHRNERDRALPHGHAVRRVGRHPQLVLLRRVLVDLERDRRHGSADHQQDLRRLALEQSVAATTTASRTTTTPRAAW